MSAPKSRVSPSGPMPSTRTMMRRRVHRVDHAVPLAEDHGARVAGHDPSGPCRRTAARSFSSGPNWSLRCWSP